MYNSIMSNNIFELYKDPSYCASVPDELMVPNWVPPATRVNLMNCYVRDAMRDPMVREYAFQFASRDPENVSQSILDGQNWLLRYGLDCGDGSCELLRRARLIMRDGWGDCKKKSIVTAAMMQIVGIPARVVWLHQQENGMSNNHVAVQMCREGLPSATAPTAVKVIEPKKSLNCKGQWVWVETTLPGAIVGNDPYQELKRLGNALNRNSL